MLGRGRMMVLGSLVLGLSGTALLAQAPVEVEEPETRESDSKPEDEKPRLGIPDDVVTVTATRVETDLMKTPIAVSVFDQETLEQAGVQNLRDMADMVPNLDIATINGQSTPIISLRGIRSTNETELGDPSVGVHLDGIYSPRMQGILGLMFDNERVEVLRGPQGTLFGRNSTVGSVNIISAKPKLDEFDSRLSLQYGNYDWTELQGMVNVPVTDTFGLRFAGRFHRRDSYIDGYWDPNQYDQRHLAGVIDGVGQIAPGSFEDCTSPECFTRTQHSNWWLNQVDDELGIFELVPADDDDFYMNANEWAYRVSGLWEPKEEMSLNFSFQHYRSDSAGGVDLVNCEKLRGRPVYDIDEEGNNLGIIGTNDCGDMFPEDDTYQAVVNVPGRFFLDIMYARAQFTWDIKDNLRFIWNAGGEDQDRESAQDMEQALNAWDGAMFFLPGTGSQSWMNEAQLQSQGNERLNWIVGANFFHEETATIGYFDNPIDEKALWIQPDRSTDAWALFAQGTYSLREDLHLTFGLRYSDETKQDVGGVTYLCNNVNGCAPGQFEREALNDLPDDFFEDPSLYPDVSPNDNRGSWSHTDWRIGIDWDKGNSLFYSYLATGFKSGGIGDVFEETNPRTGEEIIARTAFAPEEVLTFELGAKSQLLDGKLDLSVAYFYTDYEDMQYASVGAIAFTDRWQALREEGSGEFQLDEFGNIIFDWVTAPIIAYFTQNVPGAQIQGLEVEYDARPWLGGRIHGFGTWLDTEITEDWFTSWNYDAVSYFGIDFQSAIDPSNELLGVNLKGNELAVSPPFSLRMTVEHAFFFSKDSALTPWITAYWEDDSYLTIWNVEKHTDDLDFVILDQDIQYTDDKREAWSMLHAGVRWNFGDLTAELYGYNLTNEVVQYWGAAAEQVAKGSFSMPRTYGVRLGYQF